MALTEGPDAVGDAIAGAACSARNTVRTRLSFTRLVRLNLLQGRWIHDLAWP